MLSLNKLEKQHDEIKKWNNYSNTIVIGGMWCTYELLLVLEMRKIITSMQLKSKQEEHFTVND